MKKHFQYWGAVYILAVLFLISIILQWYFMDAAGVGDEFWAATFENHQSEWLQLIMQALLLLALGHKLFKADKHDVEEIKSDLKEIKDKLHEQSSKRSV